ncbi:type II secretion system protein N [Aliagarivorans taiwanensis]|uniref:type II secretion system protein N n=1 Tax=Aliagarivorans taiwanensis TaxID=561966 RepID=UPI0004146B9F|nr:type II secretion system protein N [Aliagarivorans taiwanensis]
MKKFFLSALLLILVYLGSLLYTLPAHVVLQFVPLPKGLTIGQVDGRIWEGSAKQVRVEGIELDKLEWDFRPFALLTGKLALELEAEHPSLRASGVVEYGSAGLAAKGWKANVDAEWLISQIALPVPASAEGRLFLELSEALVQPENLRCDALQGTLEWVEPVLQTPIAELGFDDMFARLDSVDGQLRLALNHQDPMIDLESEVLVGAGNWRSSGKLKAGAELPEMLANNMHYIGNSDSQGYYRFNQRGRL